MEWPALGRPIFELYTGEQFDPHLGLYYLRAKKPLAEIRAGSDPTPMKTVDIAAARSDLDSLLQLVAEGESVQILAEKKAIANLVPASALTGWQDSWKRLDEVCGSEAAPGKPGSDIVTDGRR